jgi:hypothetical protein
MIRFKKNNTQSILSAQSAVIEEDLLSVSIDEASRYLEHKLEEVQELVNKGVIELTLTSVCKYKFRLFFRSKIGSSD